MLQCIFMFSLSTTCLIMGWHGLNINQNRSQSNLSNEIEDLGLLS